MIFFLNRAGPIRPHQSLTERGRSALLAIKKSMTPNYGGALAVQHNLKRELELQKNFFWAAANGARPDAPVDLAWVTSSLHDLAYALRLKKQGLVRKVWGGPNLIVVPQEAGSLLQSPDLDACVVPCTWAGALYIREAPYLKEKIVVWPVGTDTEFWHNPSSHAKTDFLIYDKCQPILAQEIQKELTRRGITARIITYGTYTRLDYRNALSHAWGMLWLSQSETQGLACLEAFSMNVPVLAWDPGEFIYSSPKLKKPFSFPATSVPYFDSVCGERFNRKEDFDAAFRRFHEKKTAYQPRAWLLGQNLDLKSNLDRFSPLQAL